jgi:hypothetical protein
LANWLTVQAQGLYKKSFWHEELMTEWQCLHALHPCTQRQKLLGERVKFNIRREFGGGVPHHLGDDMADRVSAQAPHSLATSLTQSRQRLAYLFQRRIIQKLFVKKTSNLGDELFSGGASS